MAHEGGLDRFLGWRKVSDLIGLGRTTAWRLRRAGDFPEPVAISPGRVAWRESDIMAWHRSRGAIKRVAPPPQATAEQRTPSRLPEPLSAEGRPEDARPPEVRPPEPRSLVTASCDGSSIDPSVPAPRGRSPKRPRATRAVAEGQLGFDF